MEMARERFSALQRAEIAEIWIARSSPTNQFRVSVLFNEPKLLKLRYVPGHQLTKQYVSVLFNEPKLLKWFI